MTEDIFKELLYRYSTGAIKALNDSDYDSADFLLDELDSIIQTYKNK